MAITRKIALLASSVIVLSGGLWLYVGHIVVIDGPWTLPWLVLESTAYAPDYSHSSFRQIDPGMTEAEVTRLLGKPMGKKWVYERPVDELYSDYLLNFDSEDVVTGGTWGTRRLVGKNVRALSSVLPVPDKVQWWYSGPRSDDVIGYRVRAVEFQDGIVSETMTGMYFD